MEIKYYKKVTNNNHAHSNTVYIGKNGQIYFNAITVENLGIQDMDRFKIGYDDSEPMDNPTTLYFIKDDDKDDSFLFRILPKNSNFLACKSMLIMTGVRLKERYKVEPLTDGLLGFKIIVKKDFADQFTVLKNPNQKRIV